MTPTRWDRISRLFDRAAELPPERRAAFLDAEAVTPAGAPDLALREEVESLLAADAPDGYLSGGLAPAPEAPAPPPEAGPWRLVERVGQGGMGEVWRAEREAGAGFEQTAAVKLVRPGLGDRLTERFRAERQTLARLEHPGIARLLGGGTASDGRPYLATEFVRGEPITAYADRRRLGVNERLALFREVCDAVAYAHARLVVHRDLKPSNVLVAHGDAAPTAGATSRQGEPGTQNPEPRTPRVKLLDFGIAKLLDADETLTQTGRPVLTPAYAAPEQEAGGPVTTATDVYGLGVLLYELLTGARPSAGGDVTRPSDAVTTADTAAGRVPAAPAAGGTGALRSTTPERLRRRLRGDLDRICLKALRADPERRYRGAAELGDDVGRHLAGLPVEARPESAAYRVGKFVRRNRALVGLAAAALVAVLAASGAALWQAAEARRALAVAERESETASEVADLLASILQQADPTRSRGAEVTVREALDVGAERIRTTLTDRPVVASRLLREIGSTYLNIGLPTEGVPILEEALALAESAPGASAFDLALARDRLAAGHLMTGDAEAAGPLLRGAIAYWGRQPLGEHRFAYAAYNNLGAVLLRAGDLDGAMAALGEGVRHAEATEGAEGALASMAHNLGKLHLDAGDYATADSLFGIALRDGAEAQGRDHPWYNAARGGRAEARLRMGRADEAARRFAELAADLAERYPEQTQRRAYAAVGLGLAAARQGAYAEADRHYGEAVRLFTTELPRQSTDVADVLADQAAVRLRLGRTDEALALAQEAAAAYAELGQGRWQRHHVASVLGAAEAAAGRRAEGVRRMAAARDSLAALRPPGDDHAREAADRLARYGS